jgi:hypothetical protein
MGGFAQAVGVLAPVTIGAIAMHQANKKAKEAEKRQLILTKI